MRETQRERERESEALTYAKEKIGAQLTRDGENAVNGSVWL